MTTFTRRSGPDDGRKQGIAEAAEAAQSSGPVERRRTLARLRRELRRVGARQYFPTREAQIARKAVEALAKTAAGAAA